MAGPEKLQKVNEEMVCDEEDKISKLPDNILHHILSFLPTQKVVATSILSMRWKNLWASVPNIDLDDSLLYSSRNNSRAPIDISCFMNFVERVLLLRDSPKIKRFRLSCRFCSNATRVHTWVSAAIKHNVEDLDLCFFVNEPFVLPHCVFNSKSLVVLKLEMNCFLQLPSSISLLRLRTLHLYLVTFPDDNSMQRLFSGCPMLEELILLDCDWMHLKTLRISSATLKILVFDDLPRFGLEDVSEDNIWGCEIKIDAENLEFFRYKGFLANDISLYNLSSLLQASICIHNLHTSEEEDSLRVVKILKGLKDVGFLQISKSTFESIFPEDNFPYHRLVFQKLTKLELIMEFDDPAFSVLMKFLQCLPKLEKLCFREGINPRMNLNGDDWLLKSVPTSILSNLKNVTLKYCRGNDVEMQFLKTLLKRAVCLERINLFPYWLSDPEKLKEFRNQLQLLPGGSKQCAIMLF